MSSAWQTLSEKLEVISAQYGITLKSLPPKLPGGYSESNEDSTGTTAEVLRQLARQLAGSLLLGDVTQEATPTKAPWEAAILSTLADSTRADPVWREHFGLRHRVDHGNVVSEATEPDCILDLARIVVCSERLSSSDELLQPSLRIIANCCADNNINRSLLVSRNGIDALKRLVVRERIRDLLLPTLFNVCTDYDEVATNHDGQPMKTDEDFVSVAEQALGSPLHGQAGPKSAIELFVDLATEHEQYVVQLIELASRSASFGLKNVFNFQNDEELFDRADKMCSSFFDYASSLKPTAEDDADDFEERLSCICQTCINLLRSSEAQILAAEDPPILMKYLTFLREALQHHPVASTRADAFLAIIYAISHRFHYSAACDPVTQNFTDLVIFLRDTIAIDQTCRTQATAIDAVLVLLNNALVQRKRISDAITQYPELLLTVLRVLNAGGRVSRFAPNALKLLTRFAMVPEGRDFLLNDKSSNIFHTLATLLGTDPSDTSTSEPTTAPAPVALGVAREVPHLARLLLTSTTTTTTTTIPTVDRVSHAPPVSPLQDPNLPILHNTLLALATTTPDEETKHAIGEYVVSFIRSFSASPMIITQPQADIYEVPGPAGDVVVPHDCDMCDPRLVSTLLRHVASERGRASAVFGLVLWLRCIPQAGLRVLDEGTAREFLRTVKEGLVPMWEEMLASQQQQEMEVVVRSSDGGPGEPRDGTGMTGVIERRRAEMENLMVLYKEVLRVVTEDQVEHADVDQGALQGQAEVEDERRAVVVELRSLWRKLSWAGGGDDSEIHNVGRLSY